MFYFILLLQQISLNSKKTLLEISLISQKYHFSGELTELWKQFKDLAKLIQQNIVPLDPFLGVSLQN